MLLLLTCSVAIASVAERRREERLIYSIASAIPIEFDEPSKIGCLAARNLTVCLDLINHFVPEVLGYDFTSRPPADTLAAVEALRDVYIASPARSQLSRAVDEAVFTRDAMYLPYNRVRYGHFEVPIPVELDREIYEVHLYASEIGMIRQHRALASRFRFWSRLFSLEENPVTLVSTMLRHIARYPAIRSSCADALLHSLLIRGELTEEKAELQAVCQDPLNIDLADAVFGDSVSREATRRVFWGAVAVINPAWDTLSKAASAAPAEFNPEAKVECLNRYGRKSDFCRRLISNFVKYAGFAVPQGDHLIDAALLDRFTAAMATPSLAPELLGNFTREMMSSLRHSFSASGYGNAGRVSAWSDLAAFRPAEAASLRGFEWYFDAARLSDVSTATKRDFWQGYRTATTSAELHRVFLQFFRNLRDHKLVTCFTRICSEVRFRRSFDFVTAASKERAVTMKRLAIERSRSVTEIASVFKPEAWAYLEQSLKYSPARLYVMMKAIMVKTVKYKYIHYVAARDKCSICLDEEHPNPLARCPVGHEFHPECLDRWMLQSNECPLCRGELPPK